MKKFYYLFVLVCLIGLNSKSILAQTDATISWPFTTGAAGQTATFSTGAEVFFSANDVSIGSNLTYAGAKVYPTNDTTYTAFQPLVQSNTASSIDAVNFNLQLNNGYSFVPSKVSLNCRRFGTNGGLIHVIWKSTNGQSDTLAKAVIPMRNSTTSLPLGVHSLSLDLSSKSIPASTGACTLEIDVYAIGNTKQIGLGNIVITGTVTGSTGIKTIANKSQEIVEKQYYTLDGKRLKYVPKGVLVVVRTLYKDGTSNSKKMIANENIR